MNRSQTMSHESCFPRAPILGSYSKITLPISRNRSYLYITIVTVEQKGWLSYILFLTQNKHVVK